MPTPLNPAIRTHPLAAPAAALLAPLLLGLTLAAAATPASAGLPPATQIVVTTTADTVDADPSTVSLREAVSLAQGADPLYEIVLADGAEYVLTRCQGGADEGANVGGDLDVDDATNVSFNGNGSTVRQTCPGERVIQSVTPEVLLELRDITITGGRSTGSGGGVFANGSVRLIDSVIEGNGSTGPNGGGGVMASLGGDVFGSIIRNNTATGDGGGIHTNEFLGVQRSTIVGNHTAGDGGGLHTGTKVNIRNSTVTGNAALGSGGGVSASDDAELGGDTVVANRAPAGANAAAGENLILDGTVIALGAGGPDCLSVGPVQPAGGSVGGDPSCGGPAPDDIRAVHPQVGLLADNGGLTPTMRPATGSPAIDRYPVGCSNSVDQRLVDRPQGPACDSGAVEGAAETCSPEFPDVGAAHAFFEEICWLAQTGITGGFDDGTFRPGQAVSRQAMAAFLYRLALEPPRVPTGPSFNDVAAAHPFFDEIEWLNSQGISTGFEDGTFRPDEPVTRQAMAAFLHRVAGSPPVLADAPTFSDVPEDHAFFGEIEWMAESGVSTGFEDGTFRPDEPVTRQAMAAFLQRLAADVVLLGL